MRGDRVGTLATILVVLFVAKGGAVEVADRHAGSRVVEVGFRCPVPLDEEEFRKRIPLRAGDRLDGDLLEASLGWLEAKEIFETVEARIEPVDEGVRVVFVLEPIPVLTGVRLRGAEDLDETEILRKARLREGEPVVEARLEEAAERIERHLAARGYPEVRVRALTRRDAPDQAFVTLRVRRGPAVRLERIRLESRGIARSMIEPAIPFSVGDVWTERSRVEGERELLRAARAAGFYEVEVEASESVHATSAEIRYEVRGGPSFRLEVRGNRILSDEDLLAEVDLGRRTVVTDGTWYELARRMRERYEAAGHPFADVSVVIEGGTETKSVLFEVKEGPEITIREIGIEGNEGLSESRILEAFETGPPDAFGRGGAFRDEIFLADLERAPEVYAAAGYRQARVVDVGYAFDDGDLRLTVRVHEGPRSCVERVVLDGPEGLPRDQLVGHLRTREGRPLLPERLEDDRRRLVEELGALGYPDALVELETSSLADDGNDHDCDRLAVLFRIVPGERVTVGDVRIRGNLFTLDRVVRKAFQVRPGDPYDPEAIADAQTDLYRLGLFRSVGVSSSPSTGPVRDVVLRVRERPAGEIQYGVGYDTRIGFRNSLQAVHRNVAGTGRWLSLRGELNLSPSDLDPDEYLVNVGAREPFFLATPYDARADVVFQRSTRSIDEFSIRRFAVSTGLEREYWRRLTTTFLIEIDDSRIFDVAPDAVLTGRDVGRLRTVSLNPILVYEGRDDPFVPTKGVFDTVRLRYGSPAIGSEVHFVKVIAQHAHYVPLPGGLTGIYALRGGWAEPLGSTAVVPIRERFFLGGRTSVRGFEENSIGPLGDDGNPIGGDLLVNGNLELRVPIVGGLLAAVFVDGGAVYLRDRGIRLDEFRESTGPGLRYLTPIGSISFDYGFKLDRRAEESIGEFHFTIGNVF